MVAVPADERTGCDGLPARLYLSREDMDVEPKHSVGSASFGQSERTEVPIVPPSLLKPAGDESLLTRATSVSPQYIAGFFDGEGSLSLWRKYIFPIVGIAQNDPAPLVAIQSIHGGHLGLYGKTYREVWHPIYQWRLQGWGKVVPFLESIVSHLIVKRSLVEAYLAFHAEYPAPGKGNRNPKERNEAADWLQHPFDTQGGGER